jgi:guanylate kinase
VQGARQIQAILPPEALRIIFIDAGSWENLEQRILARAPISDVELLARRKRYEDELTFKDHATVVVANPNGGLQQAKQDFIRAVEDLSAR